jgi:hypothetical protein
MTTDKERTTIQGPVRVTLISEEERETCARLSQDIRADALALVDDLEHAGHEADAEALRDIARRAQQITARTKVPSDPCR